MRHFAVDWSGQKSRPHSRIWLAEVRSGRLVRLESGRSRAEVMEHLIEEARRDPDFVVAFDFAFSFPEWFIRDCGAGSAEEMWRLVDRRGEDWLAACEPPFWGRPGRGKPELSEHFRRTERKAAEPAGSQPKSLFQIGGAGAVGTGSIRGMPYLLRLREAGFGVWPFDDGEARPLVVEIYPRLLTGAVKKSDRQSRESYLRGDFPEIPAELERVAVGSDDAFDAAVSAVVMARHADAVAALTGARDATDGLEGRIWWPSERRGPVSRSTPAPTLVSGEPCPFCEASSNAFGLESRHGRVLSDRYPVSRGHSLVVPRQHVKSIHDLPAEARTDLWDLVARTRAALIDEVQPDGFTIGLNEGEAAGQTVEHAHIHVIPRFDGDVRDPRGGVRWVLPERADYWSE